MHSLKNNLIVMALWVAAQLASAQTGSTPVMVKNSREGASVIASVFHKNACFISPVNSKKVVLPAFEPIRGRKTKSTMANKGAGPAANLLSRLIRSNLKLSFRLSKTINFTISYL